MNQPWTWADVIGLAIVVVLLFATAWWVGRVDDRRKREGRK